MNDPERITLFYSYSHKDERYRDKLETHLSNLRRQGLIAEWHDRKITGGTEWKGKIDAQLESARVILLLVSADFIHSDYCHDVELKRALERHEVGEARVIPIIVRPCDWQSAPFGKLQAFPKDGKAITKWKPQDEAYLDIASRLRKVLEELGRSIKGSLTNAAGGKTTQFDEKLKVSLRGHGAATSVPPFGTGEPLHLALDLTVSNIGVSPVFLVSAELVDAAASSSLHFKQVCNENEPLQAGARRKETLNLLYRTPFPQGPRHPRTQEQLNQENLMVFRLLRFICQKDSVFRIETGRGTILTYPAVEVCDKNFLGWPYLVTPQDILKEHGSKSLEDFDEETRIAFEKAGAKVATISPINFDVINLEFNDLTNESSGSLVFVTPHPCRYHAELGVTNPSDRPVYIKSVSVKVGTRTYKGDLGAEPTRIEPQEFKEVVATFPVEGHDALRTGHFELTISPAVGHPAKVSGEFPLKSENVR